MVNKVSKTIGLLHKLQKILPKPSLTTIYMSFTKPHLDYGDIIYDQVSHVSFHLKLESIQCKDALAITRAIREKSREKLYHESGFASLESTKWYRKLCCFYQVFKTQTPRHLLHVFPAAKRAYISRHDNKLPHFKVKQLLQKLFLSFDCDRME